ncbi:MAG: hypothetical protein DHS20C19_24050 [Acidimicrobiales bacterium]|nr:MAG: hypothetical protein DHS20C19_24050 [Acidimicrobiales bacterium]
MVRQINRQVDQADAGGVVAAARIHAAAFATQVGLGHVASLSAEADRLCETTRTADPLAAADVRRRLSAIVDAYAQSTLVEIIEMGR